MIDVTAANFTQDEPAVMMDVTPIYHNVQVLNSTPSPTITTTWNSAALIMQEIIPGVYLGPYRAAQTNCLKALIENGITHIVCVREALAESNFIKPYFTDLAFTYLTLDIADSVTESIIRFFPKVKQFIDEALIKNGKVLVHGHNGTSRSATLVLAYIMEKFGLTTIEAFKYVKEKRACIKPNEGFVAQLTEYEPIYKARQTLERGESSKDNQRPKRKCEQMFEKFDNIDMNKLDLTASLFTTNQIKGDGNEEFNDYVLVQPPPSPNSEYNYDLCDSPSPVIGCVGDNNNTLLHLPTANDAFSSGSLCNLYLAANKS